MLLQLNYAELPAIRKRVPVESEPGLTYEGGDEGDDRKIPTLRSVFEAFPDDVGVNIDIKNCDERLVSAVDELIRRCGREDTTVWGSFSHDTTTLCAESVSCLNVYNI